MAKTCAVTHKSVQTGGRYSNRIRATQFNPGGTVRRKANVQKRRIYVPELDRWITAELSAKAIKTINKKGAYQTLTEAGVI
ncbi:50S ribosomal protein L28 [Patescibacteria group bacterium]|jgi:large subunit ribosomal protein L28|nr:50S ribosomal protein L28 [Patescibacteria group bacterium]